MLQLTIKKSIAAFVSLIMMLMIVSYFPSSAFRVNAVTSADLSISDNGIQFICSLEGFHSTCYSDYSQSSIGYGTKCNGSSVQPHASGMHSITREQAMAAMKSEINSSYAPNVRRQTSGITMNQNQFDALVSLCYNCGGGTSLISNSPLVKYLRGELSESEARSRYSSYIVTAGGKVLQGLINRRNAEANLFFMDSTPDLGEIQNLGDHFTAYIINTSAWKFLTNESDNNVDMRIEVKTAEQMWQFTRKNDGSYKIINCKTGLALDSGGTDGNLYTFTDCDNDYQSWYIYGESGSYYLRSKAYNTVIDIVGASTDDGTNAWMYEFNQTTAQKFQIWKLDNGNNLGVINDLGDSFNAYIINTEAWKLLTNEEDDNVDMRTETKKAEQMWQFTRKADGSYKIINSKTGKALDSGGANDNLYTFTDCDNEYQSWYIFGNDNAYFLTTQATNSVIDIAGASTEDGTNAQMYECNGTTAQKFQIYKIDNGNNLGIINDLGDKFTAYIKNTNSDKVLSCESDDNIVQREKSGLAEQMWQFIKKDDGSYKIMNCKTGLVLDSGGTDDNLYSFTDCDNSYQSWYIFGKQDAYSLTSQATNGVIDIAGASTEDGVNAQIYESNGTAAQKFSIQIIDNTGNMGKIQNIGDDFTAYVVNVGAQKPLTYNSDSSITIDSNSNSASQVWHFTRNDDGSYKIASCKNGLVLDSGGKDSTLYTYKDCDNKYQSWYLFGDKDGYIFISQALDSVIDIAGNATANGTIAQMYESNGTTAQKFIIETVNKGDVNADGDFTVADVVLLQKWLLAVPDTHLACWQAADMCKDGKLDVFDLCLMKRKLING